MRALPPPWLLVARRPCYGARRSAATASPKEAPAFGAFVDWSAARQFKAYRTVLDVADDSSSSDVGARYAQALFDLSVETGVLEPVERDVASLRAMRAESHDLRELLITPRIGHEEKAKALDALADRAGFDETTRKFLGLVALNRRTAALPAIIASFEKLSAARRGVVLAQVTTAVPLDPAQTEGLKSALRAALGKDPEMQLRVDPAILGGVKVRVGSRLYDASLKSRLDSLKYALKRA